MQVGQILPWFANEKGKELLSMHLNSAVVLRRKNVQVSLKKHFTVTLTSPVKSEQKLVLMNSGKPKES